MSSILTSSISSGHSAHVEIGLRVNGILLPVAQMGPDFLLMDNPIELPPGEASLFLQVDESKREWNVYLPEGISPKSKRVAIAKSQEN